MKEKIYTIPVNEAFESPGECPICMLSKKLDEEILDYILGPSYMEEDIREETDRIGFCKYHYNKMYEAQNRLGVALMVSTHLKHIIGELGDIIKADTEQPKKHKHFKKSAGRLPLKEYTDKLECSCYACKRISKRMESYTETFFYLWKKEPEFREKVAQTNGFCLEHFSMLIEEAHKRMNASEFSEFVKAVVPLQMENLSRIDGELDWFIKKFDYRFQEEPWKNSRDSLKRAILKVSSAFVNDK